ncbi:MAG: hypothetical protein TREMPRED_000638, partial [Tremellales sp. Tagirdzhanova-0007]
MPPVKVERMEPIVISDDDDAPKRESKKQPRILRTSRIILHPPIPTATINVLDQNQSPPLLLSPRKIGPSTRGDEGDARVIPRKHPRPKLISTWRPSKEIAATQKSIASFTHADPLRQQSKATASDPIDLCSLICLPDGEAEQGVKERGHKEQVEVDEIRETVDMTSNAAPDLLAQFADFDFSAPSPPTLPIGSPPVTPHVSQSGPPRPQRTASQTDDADRKSTRLNSSH